jgi:hypothetical protein
MAGFSCTAANTMKHWRFRWAAAAQGGFTSVNRRRSVSGYAAFLRERMLNALRYYWITAKGYRLCPWKSPYIQWRLETFYGKEAAGLDAPKFFSLMWRERARMRRFLAWVAVRRRAQRH